MSTNIQEYLKVFFKFLTKASAKWEAFVKSIKEENRFFPSNNISNYLEQIYKNNVLEINRGEIFYRARKMNTDDKSEFYYEGNKVFGYKKEEMEMPPREKVTDGRANPTNIPYLYVASNEKTACAEVRCELYDVISIIGFTTNKNIKVIDLTQYKMQNQQTPSLLFWSLREAFRKYNNNNDKHFYIPTQYVTAFFANKSDIDGIKYPTARETGENSYNLVLFSKESVDANSERASIYICSEYSCKINEINDPDLNRLDICATLGTENIKVIEKMKKKIIKELSEE